MNLAGALACVILFGLLLHFTRIIPNSRAVIARARESIGVMRDPALDDHAREKAIQAHSLGMFALLGKLCLGAVIALGVPVILLWLVARAGWLDFDAVMALMLDPWFIAATVVIAIVGFRLARR